MNELGEPVEHRDDTIDRLIGERDQLRAIAHELAAALRIAGACDRCKGSGKMTYHPRGPHAVEPKVETCDRCGGLRYAPGAAAAIGRFEGAEKTGGCR